VRRDVDEVNGALDPARIEKHVQDVVARVRRHAQGISPNPFEAQVLPMSPAVSVKRVVASL
jgi:hypothetical protein